MQELGEGLVLAVLRIQGQVRRADLVEVRGDRRMTLAMRWIIAASRAKKGKPISKRLADEFVLASKNEGTAIKKKLDTHRMAEANKAFAHFAW